MNGRLLTGVLLCLSLLAVFAVPSLGTMVAIRDLFNAGDYEGARQNLHTGEEGARLGEDILWRSRLAASPEEACDLLGAAVNDSRLPGPTRQRMVLELAELQFARGNYQDCLKVLKGAMSQEEQDLPGEAYLLAGMTYRLLGQVQSAREMLASVRPGDPAFVRARYYLGTIGLQQGDHALALRYFQSGAQGDRDRTQPDLLGGQWQALRLAGQAADARGLQQSLNQDHPGSLALLEINRILREEADDLAQAALDQAPLDSVVTSQPTPAGGRFSLQIGAFSDRALALEYMNRHKADLPDLRVDQVQDERGQFLYKVRTGSYVNPAIARSEAARLKREMGIDVIVTDASSTLYGRD